MFKKRKLRKLKEFHERIVNPKSKFPEGYIEGKQTEINILEWLIAFYEDRAASTPKELLEVYLRKYGYYHGTYSIEEYQDACKSMHMLYEWVYKNKITGF